MSPIIPVVCLCLSLSAPPPRDKWLAEDKLKHMFASFVVTTISSSAIRAAGASSSTSVWAGAAVGVGAGAWKELTDLRRRGETASYKDFVWDVAGVGAASVLVRQAR
jgi:uncharacterized protein YfiM (DUF2279 family)